MLDELLIEKHENTGEYKKYLTAIIDSSLDGITVVDEQGKFEFGNDSFFRIIGWPKEEIIGQYFMKIIPEEMHEYIMGHWKSILNDQQGGLHEIKIKTSYGEIRYVYVSSSLIELNGKNKVVAILHDIAEKRRFEYIKTIIESSIDGIAVVDDLGKIEFGNNAFFNIVGWPREDLSGQSFEKMLTDDTKQLYLKVWREARNSLDTEKVAEAKIITKDGEIRYLLNSRVSMILNGEKKYIFSTKNITEQKKLELKLRESEEKYRDLFENAGDTMYVLDIEGNVLKMNITGLQILGCTKEEVIGKNISKWITPESMKIVNERKKKHLMGEIVNNADVLEIVCKNGEHRWIEIKTRWIKDGERIIEIHGIARDITENILLKHELNKSNKHRKLLCYLIEGTRGGKTRALILKHLAGKSYNANQLATLLNMDYKTIRHHLDVLIKNGIIGKINDGYSDLYFITLSEYNNY